MKLGYSNYGMRQIDIFESLARVRSIGYEAMEVCSRDGWQTAAVDFDMSSRRRLVASLKELNLPPPPVIDGISILGMATADAHSGIIQRARNTLRLVADLNFGHEPGLLTTTVGELTAGQSRRTTSWDSCKEIIRDGFLELADLAADFGVIVCVEAHAGSALATPTEARWLMENTGHDNLKVDCDVSHFVTQSIDMNEISNITVPSLDGITVVVGDLHSYYAPSEFALSAAYPNPFNPSTSMNIDLNESGHVNVMVYNVLGQVVSTLVNGHMDAGYHSIEWNAKNMPSGMYLVKVHAGENIQTQKLMLLK